jgi:hypothetical protein
MRPHDRPGDSYRRARARRELTVMYAAVPTSCAATSMMVTEEPFKPVEKRNE